ncbi:MAG: MBL fold metallo-hydrolase [Proteobacteria bacterium]|nr:MBL fold metallo-hydrolase [Cystobacterineae bacterium]MCL2259371.1 MBL fold metallo-hydrolase [Cystobacterineae bacterium]MCL2314407.1 MBL fold metallo-hydrolase [Pseudomonadota bacterium]
MTAFWEGKTSAWDEAQLQAFGIIRLEVPVPFADTGGPANIYAIENGDGSLSLWDCGFGTLPALAHLRKTAATRGVALEKVSRIFISHAHVDHYGAAEAIAAHSNARIYIHPLDADKVVVPSDWTAILYAHGDYMRRLGVSEVEMEEMKRGFRGAEAFAPPVAKERLTLVEEGEAFSFAKFSAEILHAPGHSAGLICLWAREPNLLFSNDQVLERVAPAPFLDLSMGEGEGKFLSLVEYIASAKRFAAMPFEAILPGHGAAFVGHRALLEALLVFYEQRGKKLLQLLSRQPLTVREVVGCLFANIDTLRIWPMLSGVLAAIEVLEKAGQVKRREEGGRFIFEATVP